MVFRSKKDGWLVAIITLVAITEALIFVWGVYNLISLDGNAQAGWLMVLVSVLTGFLFVGVLYPLYYEIGPSDLIVRSGLLR